MNRLRETVCTDIRAVLLADSVQLCRGTTFIWCIRIPPVHIRLSHVFTSVLPLNITCAALKPLKHILRFSVQLAIDISYNYYN